MTHNDLRYEFGPYQLNPSKHLLTRNGEGIPLTPKATEILLLLVKHEQRPETEQFAPAEEALLIMFEEVNDGLGRTEKNQISDKLKRPLGTTQQPALRARVEMHRSG